jgi:hypothetical protein
MWDLDFFVAIEFHNVRRIFCMYINTGTYSLSCERSVKCSVTTVDYGHWKVA